MMVGGHMQQQGGRKDEYSTVDGAITHNTPETEKVVRLICRAFPYMLKERIRQAVFSCCETMTIPTDRGKIVSCTLERLGLIPENHRASRTRTS
jgi:hypothetical protein